MQADTLLIESGLRWYTIQTKGNREREVAKRLGDLELEIFLPWLRTRRRVGGKFQWVLIPLFPGYLFCRLDLIASGKAARYAPGVKDFLKFGNAISAIPDEIILTLRERCPQGIAEILSDGINPGDPVKINEGPFAGLDAVFEKKMRGAERVAVLLNILGRQTRLVVRGETVAKL
jgi:transcriptional antiterminator RfaH